MTHNTRTFTRDELEELDVPHTHLHDELNDTGRWTEMRTCVFRAPDDDKTYLVSYQKPLTEYQECDLWYDEDEITAMEVEEVIVAVTRWEPTRSAS